MVDELEEARERAQAPAASEERRDAPHVIVPRGNL
jgi:hypothetical protein